MKKVLFFLIGFFLIIDCYSQQSINGQIGYSRSMGFVGIDYQFKKIAVGVGYLPVSTSENKYNSFSSNLTWCDYTYNRSGYYLSIAFASAGYYPTEISESKLDEVAPMGLINIGYKTYLGEGLNFKTEIGYGISKIENVLTVGITIGYTIKLPNQP